MAGGGKPSEVVGVGVECRRRAADAWQVMGVGVGGVDGVFGVGVVVVGVVGVVGGVVVTLINPY